VLQFVASQPPATAEAATIMVNNNEQQQLLNLARIRRTERVYATSRSSSELLSLLLGRPRTRRTPPVVNLLPVLLQAARTISFLPCTGMPEIVPSASRRCRNENSYCFVSLVACRCRGPSGLLFLTSHREYRAPFFSAWPST
jgi:hypothetical protein